jgi:hypothetical protein
VSGRLTRQSAGHRRGRGFEKAHRLRLVLQERLDFPPERLVSITRLFQERATLARVAIQGRMIEVGDLLSPIWFHGRRIPMGGGEGAKSLTRL